MESCKEYVSVVIPTYNGGRRIVRMFPLLEEQDYPNGRFEVIVVDDASGKETQESLAACRPAFDFRYIRHCRNAGRAAACNSGIRSSRGETVIIIDDDMSFAPHFISGHARYHGEKGKIAAVGMVKMIFRKEDTAFVEFCRRRERIDIAKNLRQRDDLPRAGTANFSIRKDILLEAGLFDESFTVYGCEDTELVHRLRKSGVRLLYAPECLAWHAVYADDFKKYCERRMLVGYSGVTLVCLHPELAQKVELDSLLFWKGSPKEILKKIIRGIMFNSFTIPWWRLFISFCDDVLGFGFDFFYDQVGAHYYRRGLRRALWGEGL